MSQPFLFVPLNPPLARPTAMELQKDSHIPILMLSGQIDVPKRAASAVDAFVAKGQPPAVLLGRLTALAEGGPRKHLSFTSGRASR